jgi:hypothetical protein
MQLSSIIKNLKDSGIIDAIIEGRPIEQRCVCGHDHSIPNGWHPWTGSQTVLLDGGDKWEVRVARKPREWWLRLCDHHSAVYCVQPSTINNCCEIVHVIEDMK